MVSAEEPLRSGWERVRAHDPELVDRWTQRPGRRGYPAHGEGVPAAVLRKQLLPLFLAGEFPDTSALLNKSGYRSLNHDEARRLEEGIAGGAPRIIAALRLVEALDEAAGRNWLWRECFSDRSRQWRNRKFVEKARKGLAAGQPLPSTREEADALLEAILERESVRPTFDMACRLLDDLEFAADLTERLNRSWRPACEGVAGPRAGAARALGRQVRELVHLPFQAVDAAGREVDLPEMAERWRAMRARAGGADEPADRLLRDRVGALGLTRDAEVSSISAPVRLRGKGAGRAPLDWSFEERVASVLRRLPEDYRTADLSDDLRGEAARCAHWMGLDRPGDRLVLLLAAVVVEEAQRLGWRRRGAIDRPERRTLVDWLIAAHGRVERMVATASSESVLYDARWTGRAAGVDSLVDLRGQPDAGHWVETRLLGETGRTAWRRLHRREYVGDLGGQDLTSLSRDLARWMRDAARFLVERQGRDDEQAGGSAMADDAGDALMRGLYSPAEQRSGLGRRALGAYLAALWRCRDAGEPADEDRKALAAARRGIGEMLRRWRREGVMRAAGAELTVGAVVAVLESTDDAGDADDAGAAGGAEAAGGAWEETSNEP